MPRGPQLTTAPRLCPGHKGRTPCSDGGLRAPRSSGQYRSHCRKHWPFISQEKRLRKNIQDFFDASGVDLSNQHTVDTIANPPVRKTLTRPVRPRAPSEDLTALVKELDNLKHKLADTQRDYANLKRAKQSSDRKVRRLSQQFGKDLEQEQAAFDLKVLDVRSIGEVHLAEERRRGEVHLAEERRRSERQKSELQSELDTVQSQVETQLLESTKADRRLQKQIDYIAKLKTKVKETASNSRAKDEELADIERKYEQACAELAASDKLKATRARTSGDPRHASKRRSELLLSCIPEHWLEESIRWTIARVAAASGVRANALAESVVALTTLKNKHKGASIEHKLKEDVANLKEAYRACDGDGAALSRFLQSIEQKILLDQLPGETRMELTRQWVAKLQAFWSKSRCALLKSVTCTSNENWQWFRGLLGRVVEDGKWKDLSIDGKIYVLLYT